MSKPTRLTSRSTLGDLPLHFFQVSPNTLGQFVAQQFHQEPWLPGVIIAEEGRLLGMISRRKFNEWMSSPYGPDIFLERPIEVFLSISQPQKSFLLFPEEEKITRALVKALERTADNVYEPLIITSRDAVNPELGNHFLLEFQTLVRAHSEITQNSIHEASQHRLALKRSSEKLEQQEQKVKKISQLLESQQGAIAEHQQLAAKQAELEQALQDVSHLNQHLLQMSATATQEGKAAFGGTFAGINLIVENTNDIVEIGRLLSEELDKIYTTSHLIKRISEQVWYLSVQAAIVANQSDTEISRFSQITNEIGNMVNHSLEASREMNRVASAFTEKLASLTTSAQTGLKSARSLIKKIQRAQQALEDLEMLIVEAGVDLTNFIPDDLATEISDLPDSGEMLLASYTEGAQTLAQKIAHTEISLSDLGTIPQHPDSTFLIQKIQRTLKRHRDAILEGDSFDDGE
ncbi:hypothetical protein [Spirulina subsalsa]|uniref:hypothetical protein n=1 Tax=Spirulina subsalsa TaxID=54311 RepID=UPI00037612C4|nr:hypothetical protein [Spirulina subsalsa]